MKNMQSQELSQHHPDLEATARVAEQMIDREGYVVNTLNELTVLAGFKDISYFVHDEEAYCTDERGRVGIPREAFQTSAEQIDILDGLSHELCAHIFDSVHNPRYVNKLRSFERSGEDESEKNARHVAVNVLTDIVGNNWKARVFPRLGIDQAEVYGRILMKKTDQRGEPRFSQVLHKLLRDAMVPGESVIIDDDLVEKYEEILKFATPTLDRRSASDDDRYDIWTELVWPKLAELLEQDKADRPQKSTQSIAQMMADHDAACSHSDGEHIHAVQESNDGPSKPSMSFAKAFIQAKQEAEQKAGSSGAGSEAVREELTGHSLEDRLEYAQVLQKYAPTLDELEEAYRQFLTRDKILVKKHRVVRDGEEIHPDMLVSGFIAMKAGEERPAMWDEIVRKERYKTRPGPFDMWIVSDATGSMKNNDLAQVAAESTALLSQSFERYNVLASQLLEDPSELDFSRLSVVTFAGLATVEQPLVAFASDKQRLDAYHHVREAAGTNTIIGSGVDAVRNMHTETDPPRRKLVVILSDGDDNQVGETKASIQNLINLGFTIRFLNFSGDKKGYQNEELISSPQELPSIMVDIARSIIDEEIS